MQKLKKKPLLDRLTVMLYGPANLIAYIAASVCIAFFVSIIALSI